MVLTQHIVRKMIQSGLGGSILFISSIHEKIIRGKIAYSSSKAALKMVVQELSVDLAGFGIRVNGISPGYVKVNEKGDPLPQKHTPLWNTSIPPEYIGRAAVYLSSDHFSRFTTGSILKIDAGLSLNNFAFDPVIRKG